MMVKRTQIEEIILELGTLSIDEKIIKRVVKDYTLMYGHEYFVVRRLPKGSNSWVIEYQGSAKFTKEAFEELEEQISERLSQLNSLYLDLKILGVTN